MEMLTPNLVEGIDEWLYPEVVLPNLPSHFVVYGESGAGKTTFAATFPKPMIFFAFDTLGKFRPVFGQALKEKRLHQTTMAVGNAEVPVLMVCNKAGVVTVQIELYHDVIPEKPAAYALFQARMGFFHLEYSRWATAVFDSTTAMALAKRKQSQYVLKPHVKEPRIWFGDATDGLEEMLMMRAAGLPMNVVVLCHVARDDDKDNVGGFMLRNPNLPGRLQSGIPSQFDEFYRLYTSRDKEGNLIRQLQTRADNQYNASSQLGAPDPCEPHYQILFQNET